jgi:hypothetical protein
MSYYRVAPDYMNGSSTQSSLTSGGEYYDVRYKHFTSNYRAPYLLEMSDVPQRAEREISDHGLRTLKWDAISTPRATTQEFVDTSANTSRWNIVREPSLTVETPEISDGSDEDPEFNDIEKAIALSKLFYLAEYGDEKTEEEASAPLLVEEDVIVTPQETQEPVIQIPTSPSSSTLPTVSSECTVCMDAARCIVFKPCGHVCCCEECADSILGISSPKCPLCRQDLKSRSKTKVYI